MYFNTKNNMESLSWIIGEPLEMDSFSIPLTGFSGYTVLHL
jgi:hypothetical protein